MNSINSAYSAQQASFNRTSGLRQAAAEPKLPDLTDQESNVIQEKFKPKTLSMYSMNGQVQTSEFGRGRNIDTKV